MVFGFSFAILWVTIIIASIDLPPLWRGDGITEALRLCGAGYCLCDSNSEAQYPIATLSGVWVYNGSIWEYFSLGGYHPSLGGSLVWLSSSPTHYILD